MLFAIWTGWGILVPLLVGAGLALTQLVMNAIFGPNYYETHNDVGGWIGVGIAVISIWFIGKKLNDKPGRTLIDKQTGKEIIFKRRHTFFFINMEYWAIIVLVLAVIFSFVK